VANHQIIFKMYYLLLWVKPITTIYETLETSQLPQEGLVYIKVLFSQVSLDSGTICQQTWEILLANKCLKTKYEKFMTCLTNHHYIFSTGIRIANILHARLRQKCSSLKCDLFRCNLITSCNCDFGNYIESVDHFFLKVIYILNTEYNYSVAWEIWVLI